MFGYNFREDIDTPPPTSEIPAAAASLRSKSDRSNGHRASDGAAALKTITGGDSARIDPQTSSQAMSESFARGNAAFRPIFVVGCPRSGTTLLSVMLDRHSKVAVPPETHFAARVVPYAYPEGSTISNGIETLPVQAIEDLLYQTPLNDLKLDPAAVIMRLRGCPASPATLLRSVLEEYAVRRNKSTVAEKTPGHELYFEQLSAWFPQARFVWIVRDGRAVVKSQRRMHWIHEPIWQLSLHWLRSAIQALRFEAAHPDIVFRVRYEDLLRDPHSTLGPLHRFLGIRLEPQQLRPIGPSGVIPVSENGWKMKANQPIDVRRSDAWRAETTKRQLLVMNCLMGRYLSKFGYSDTSVRHFGILAVVLYVLVDVALIALFAPRIYGIARYAYHAFKHLRRMGRLSGKAIRWGLLLLATEMDVANCLVTAVMP